MDKLLASQRVGNSFGCNAMYRTTGADYGQKFKINESNVPTYSELVEAQSEFKRAEK